MKNFGHSPAPGLLIKLLKLGGRSWWLSLVLWVAAIAPTFAAELEMRVAIEENVPQVQVGSSSDGVLKDGTGRAIAQVPAGTALVAQARGGSISISQWQGNAFWIEPRDPQGLVWINNAWYRGRTLVVPTTSGLTAVNYVDLEEYLYSVVGSEVYDNWQPEALKAQAVAARTYALYQRQTSSNTVFDVGDSQRWQVYKGVVEESAPTISAVQATRGQVVTYQGQIINAVFHSSSGGRTEDVENVWTQPLPYLRGVAAYDELAPEFRWNLTITADQARKIAPNVGNVLSFTPERTAPSGRVISMRVTGDRGSQVVSGSQLRSAFNLRSTLFTVSSQMSPVASTRGLASAPSTFQITGGGFGHGLGMSQWGAQGLALQGMNYRDILRHYYTGTILSRIRVE